MASIFGTRVPDSAVQPMSEAVEFYCFSPLLSPTAGETLHQSG
jgi:hypothetical protein